MQDGEASLDETLRPSSHEVLGELELLRRDHGISPTKIQTQAPSLLRLPVVEDQLKLKQLDPRDRHLAAYSAIGCVIDFGISDYQTQTILILSMRYDPSLLRTRPNPEWGAVISTTSLSQRHKFIQAVMLYGKTTYFERLNDAYRQLADQLVIRDHSPCREAGVEELAKLLVAATLQELLVLFSAHGQSVLMEAIAGEALPRVKSKWRTQGRTNYLTFANAINSALATDYQALYENQTRLAQSRPQDEELMPLDGKVLERIILKNRDRPLVDRVSVELGVTDPPSRFSQHGRPLRGGEPYTRFRTSIEILALALQAEKDARPTTSEDVVLPEATKAPRPQDL